MLGQRPCLAQAQPGVAPDKKSATDLGLADSSFMPADRTAILLLERTRLLLEEERFSEAVQCLDRILSGKEDFFFRPFAETSVHRSIKSEARQLLGSIPPRGRQSYELLFGAHARAMLEDAVKTGDVTGLAEVARRFFHTEAGYEATFLLGLHHLDHGRPLVGALTLRRLRDESPSAARFEPTLSVVMARAWLDAGMVEDAKETLDALRRQYPGRHAIVEGRDVPLFGEAEDPLTWLVAMIGSEDAEDSSEPDQWRLHGGGPQRWTTSSAGRPLMNSRWHVPSTGNRTVEEMIDRLQRQQEDRESPLLPAQYPLVVNNVVLMRTVTNLLAVDFVTGKRLWEVPVADPFQDALNPPPDQFAQVQPNLEVGLRLRLWGDETFGTLASDGRQVFAVEDLPLPTPPLYARPILVAGNRRASSNAPTTSNRLAAFDIRSEGKLRWELGGSYTEPRLPLAGTFFLGPPLPLLGDLYVLAEREGEVRLLALRAATGELLWEQPLAVVEQSVYYDVLRRVAGVSPSYADGILVCPTSRHSIVALDLTTRSLLWGYSYGDTELENERAPSFFGIRHRTGDPEERWTDSNVMLAEGHVLVAPVDSDQLHCLSLRDGKLLWRLPREDKLFLATVADGNVVVASRKGLTAFGLADGKEVWQMALASCAADTEPSGRGFSDGTRYYLPLTDGRLVVVGLAEGVVEQVIKSRNGRSLGNLVCHGGKILSQNAEGLELFPQLDALRIEVGERLAANPNDAQALAYEGEILWEEGDLGAGVQRVRKSLQLADSIRTRELLRDMMFEGLATSFAQYREFRDEIESLLETAVEQATLHRLMATGFENAGEYDRALTDYRALVALDLDDPGFVNQSDEYSVRQDRWIRARLQGLCAAAPENVGSELLRWSKERLQSEQQAGASPDEFGRVVAYFEGLPGTENFKADWIERLVAADRLAEAELALISEVHTPDAPPDSQALARWAALLVEAGRSADAVLLLGEIATRWPDASFPNDRNGRQWSEQFRQQHADALAVPSPPEWPTGHVKSAVTRTEQGRAVLNYSRGVVPFQDGNRRFFGDLTIEHRQQHLEARNALGQIVWRFPLADLAELRQLASNRALMRVDACGHLLILSLGDRLVALDTLKTKADGTPRIAWVESVDEADMTTIQRQMALARARAGAQWGLGSAGFQGMGRYSFGAALTLGENVVCAKRSRVCVALNAATGETLWQRDGISSQSMLFGDGEYVLVVPAQSSEARVFRTADGAELPPRSLPDASQRVTTVGRRILCWKRTGREYTLQMVDPLLPEKEQIVWGPHRFPLDATPQVVEHEAVAVFTPTGEFQLFDLVDGRSIVKTEFELEPPLKEVVILPRQNQFVVIANNNMVQRSPNRRSSPISQVRGRQIGSARVYAFDRQGKALWAKPAVIEDQFLPLVQPEEAPCLTFACAVIETPQGGGPQRAKIDIQCLDLRSGVIVAHKRFTRGGHSLEIEALPEEAKLVIRMQQETLTLTFTNDPIPENETADATPSNPLEAIMRAVLREAGLPEEDLNTEGLFATPSDEEGQQDGDGAKPPAKPKKDAETPPPASLRPTRAVPPPPLEPAIRDRIPRSAPAPTR